MSLAREVPAAVSALSAGRRLRTAVLLTRALAGVSAVAGALTFADPGVLRGPDVMVGSARGTGIVLALLGAPLLVAAAEAARRGSDRAMPVWLGAAGYVTYNAVLLLFATPANPLLLLYTSTFGLAVATVVAVVQAARSRSGPWRCRAARGFAVVVWVVAGLNTLIWLSDVLPGLTQDEPAYLAGTGMTTNPIYVQDLAVWLPMAALAGWWLWRGLDVGFLVGGAFLAGWVLEGVSVAVDQWMGGRADPSSGVASTSMTVPFLVLALVQLAVLVAFLRRPGTGTRARAEGNPRL